VSPVTKEKHQQTRNHIIMKNKIFISFTLIFMGTFTALHCQDLSPTSIDRNRLSPKPAFSLQDYKQDCDLRSDTIWLPRRQDVYLWDGHQLAHSSMYELLTYNNPDELSRLLILDFNTDDSLLMLDYEYDELSRPVSETYWIYDAANAKWLIDYKAIKTYDEFSCVNRILIQAWDTENLYWHDSIAEVNVYVDTNEAIDYYVEEYINKEWKRIFGYQWVYSYTPEEYVIGQCNYMLSTASGEYEYDVRADFALNDDGSYNESIWYFWDKDAEEWVNLQKYSDMEWIVHNKYPNNYKNKPAHRLLIWWTGHEWFEYYKDDWEFFGQKQLDGNMHGYSMDIESGQWYLSHNFTGRHYPYDLKRRYTYYLKDSINMEMQLFFDDSCRWYFHKGALEEMYRIAYDTTIADWRPAARLLYSDFVPFTDNTSIDDIKLQEEKLKIIPNPSKNQVEIINNIQISELSLYDGKGVRVLHLVKQQDIPKIRIDVSNMPTGIYIVKARTATNKIITDKLIVR